jgi:hypothetical protein
MWLFSNKQDSEGFWTFDLQKKLVRAYDPRVRWSRRYCPLKGWADIGEFSFDVPVEPQPVWNMMPEEEEE